MKRKKPISIMQQETPLKHIVMPSTNGSAKVTKFVDWKTIVGSIVSGLLIGTFVFSWNTNATVARVLERQDQLLRQYDDVKGDLNQLKLEARDIRDKAIRAERLNEYNFQQLQKPTK